MKHAVFQGLAEAARRGEPVALGLISGVKGSSPQKAGAKALFYRDGRQVGTLGGGCLEAEVQRRALQALDRGLGGTFELVLDHDFGWDDGLLCGGQVQGVIVPNAQGAGEEFWTRLAERKAETSWGIREDYSISITPAETLTRSLIHSPADSPQGWLYCETVTPACALWIAGAGHIARAVAPLAVQLDFEVTVFDDRPALASRQFFPGEVSLQADGWEKLLGLPLPEGPSFGLIVTRGHRHDALVLQDWIHKPFGFLGMIGSARKARAIFEHFKSEKLATVEELQRVACPVGVPIRCRSVMEIAVSIMAQFIDKRAELVGH